MKQASALAALMILTSVIHGATPADRRPKPLVGVYAITNLNIDPLPGAPSDPHFVVKLHGESAEALYGAMKAEPRPALCGGDSAMEKRQGHMSCVHDPSMKFYACSFAVRLETQTIEGLPC